MNVHNMHYFLAWMIFCDPLMMRGMGLFMCAPRTKWQTFASSITVWLLFFLRWTDQSVPLVFFSRQRPFWHFCHTHLVKKTLASSSLFWKERTTLWRMMRRSLCHYLNFQRKLLHKRRQQWKGCWTRGLSPCWETTRVKEFQLFWPWQFWKAEKWNHGNAHRDTKILNLVFGASVNATHKGSILENHFIINGKKNKSIETLTMSNLILCQSSKTDLGWSFYFFRCIKHEDRRSWGGDIGRPWPMTQPQEKRIIIFVEWFFFVFSHARTDSVTGNWARDTWKKKQLQLGEVWEWQLQELLPSMRLWVLPWRILHFRVFQSNFAFHSGYLQQ